MGGPLPKAIGCDPCHILPGVVDSESVAVGHVGDGGGSRVGNSEQSWGGGNGLNGWGTIDGWVGIGWGSVSWRSIGSWGVVSGWVGSGNVSNGQSWVADAHVRLAHRRVRGVDGLGVGRDLAQVAVGAEDVRLLAGDGRGVDSGVGGSGWVQRVGGLAHGNGGSENNELEKKVFLRVRNAYFFY